MVTVKPKKFRLVNPHSSKAPTVKAKRAPRKTTRPARNPGALYLLGATAAAANPHKGAQMAQQKAAKKKKTPAARKTNPTAAARPTSSSSSKALMPYRPKPRKKNPDLGAILGQPIEFLKFGLIALFGLVATRQVPQMALGDKNTSWLGYLANLGTALGGAYGTSQIAGKTAGIAFGTGGGLYTAQRILNDKFTPVGKVLSLSGLGDPMASPHLGRIVPGSVYPAAYDAQGNLKLPPAFIAAARAAMIPPAAAAAAGSGMGRLAGSRSRLAA